jgi:hypothetical protein
LPIGCTFRNLRLAACIPTTQPQRLQSYVRTTAAGLPTAGKVGKPQQQIASARSCNACQCLLLSRQHATRVHREVGSQSSAGSDKGVRPATWSWLFMFCRSLHLQERRHSPCRHRSHTGQVFDKRASEVFSRLDCKTAVLKQCQAHRVRCKRSQAMDASRARHYWSIDATIRTCLHPTSTQRKNIPHDTASNLCSSKKS